MSEPLSLESTEVPVLNQAVDAVILPVFKDGEPGGNAAAAEVATDGLLADMRSRREIRGEAHEVTVVPTFGRLPAARLAYVGLGARKDFNTGIYRLAMAAAGRQLGRRGLHRIAVDLTDVPLPLDEAACALAEGLEFSRFQTGTFRSGERRETRILEAMITGGDEAIRAAASEIGLAIGRGKNLARGMVNEPPNILDAPELARRARGIASESGLELSVHNESDLERLKMGAFLAVARGTETPAKLLVLRHTGARGGPLLVLVGKAVTFDTGGISLKPAADMAKMKGDLAGGVAVLGAMQAIAEVGVPLNVIGLIPAVDNMPDGNAWKPADVITSMNGRTIETISTDAEGRMLLADTLCYAQTLGATHIVDIATLTGACLIALGHVASALYGTDPRLVSLVRDCGEDAGERHWPMPLFPEYRELIRSDIADLKNSGGRLAGSVSAAWFLREFAGDTPWAHLDIAGSASYEKNRPWAPAGPTGTGVGTFVRLAQRLAKPNCGAR
jgi:leucyl aminopeptidase